MMCSDGLFGFASRSAQQHHHQGGCGGKSCCGCALAGMPPLIPLILIPGDGSNQLEAQLDKPSRTPWYCAKHRGWSRLWLDVSALFPGAIECWTDNIRLVVNASTGRATNVPGVTTRVPGWGTTTGETFFFSLLTHPSPVMSQGICQTAFVRRHLSDAICQTPFSRRHFSDAIRVAPCHAPHHHFSRHRRARPRRAVALDGRLSPDRQLSRDGWVRAWQNGARRAVRLPLHAGRGGGPIRPPAARARLREEPVPGRSLSDFAAASHVVTFS